MTAARFRPELDFYEIALAEWAKFTVKTCPKFVRANSIGSDMDATLSLVFEVADGERPIKCKTGEIVRLLILDFGDPAERTVH